MNLKQQLDADLKTAMLAGDKVLTTTLRGLKSAILYAEVAEGNRESGLSDEAIVQLFTKESKKRQESADLYMQGGNIERAEVELAEKKVIAGYLPEQISDEELDAIIEEAQKSVGGEGMAAMGRIIGVVKQKVGAQADGARIADSVKRRIAS